MFAFNVWLNNRLIDTVFYSIGKTETKVDAIESVRHSLINHDGYSSEIKVTWPKGQRITKTVYVIQGNYGQGFEDENEEENEDYIQWKLDNQYKPIIVKILVEELNKKNENLSFQINFQRKNEQFSKKYSFLSKNSNLGFVEVK